MFSNSQLSFILEYCAFSDAIWGEQSSLFGAMSSAGQVYTRQFKMPLLLCHRLWTWGRHRGARAPCDTEAAQPCGDSATYRWWASWSASCPGEMPASGGSGSCPGEIPASGGSSAGAAGPGRGLWPPRRCYGAANTARSVPGPAPRSLREDSPEGDTWEAGIWGCLSPEMKLSTPECSFLPWLQHGRKVHVSGGVSESCVQRRNSGSYMRISERFRCFTTEIWKPSYLASTLSQNCINPSGFFGMKVHSNVLCRCLFPDQHCF